MADVEALKKQHAADVEVLKDKARKAIEKLRTDIDVVKNEAQGYKSQLESAQHELASIRDHAHESDERVAQYQRKVAELENNVSSLNQMLRSQESKTADERDEKIASLTAELSRAQNEIARLHENESKSNHSPGGANDEIVQLREALHKADEKLNRFKEAAKTQVLKLQDEVRSKDKERSEAIILAEQLQKQLEETMSAVASQPTPPSTDDVVHRFENAEANLSRATSLLEESENAKKAAQAQVAKMEADFAAFKEKAKRHVEKLQSELERRQQIEEQLKKTAEEENKKLVEVYENQLKTLKEATSTASMAAATAAKSPAPSDALIRMNKENKDLQAKLEVATKSLQEEREEAKAQAKASREAIERASKERTDLKRELDSAKEDLRVATKDLEKMRNEIKKLQDHKVATDPVEMQKRKDAEMQVYTDRIMKLETELRKEQAKSEDLTKQIQRFDAEIARLTGQYLEKYNQLDRELGDKREQLALLEEQNAELKRTNILGEQRLDELKKKSREQFQNLMEQLEQAKSRMEEAVKAEQTARAEINALSSSLKRQNSASSAAQPQVQQQQQAVPTPQSSPPPQLATTPRADFKLLEEEKLKAESKRREAMDDLTKAKRDYNSAKREAIQLAESVDKLRAGLNKAALQAGGNLALAADRCDDALRQCVLQIEAALAALQARELAQSKNPSQSAGLADENDPRFGRSHRQSSLEDVSSPMQGGKKDQEPEERLVNALNDAEHRLDEMASHLRALLPKVKQVVTAAVQEKKNPNVLASICNLSAIFAKLFQRTRTTSDDHGHGAYQGLQRPGARGGRRVLPETPGTESGFDLEEES